MSLVNYLKEAHEEGAHVGEGQFSLAAPQAIEKLGEFALPCEASWIVKLIQACVASGISTQINVKLNRDETRISFAPTRAWNLTDIEVAFFDLGNSEQRFLNHLKHALWATGIGGRRAFSITLPGQTQSLVWNGVRLKKVSCAPIEKAVIEVTPLGVGAIRSSWIGRRLLTAERNADVVKAVTKHLCTCPVPLTVDGRRFDGLELMPVRGWGENAVPFVITTAAGTLPTIPLPVGTLERTGLAKSAELVETSVLVMATSYLEWSRVDFISCQATEEASQVVWVADGAVLESEDLDVKRFACAATVFLSAHDLGTDLTGFQLRESAEKQARLDKGIRAAGAALMALVPFESQVIKVTMMTKGTALTYCLMAAGVSSVAISPFLSVFLLGAGLKSSIASSAEREDFREWLAREYNGLAMAWKDWIRDSTR